MKFYLIIALFWFTTFSCAAQEPFVFNNTRVEVGSKKHFQLPVVFEQDSTVIPVTVFHGFKSGEVLGITAGIHGYEYPPIIAGQQLVQKIDPNKLSGTVILVNVANVPAFLGRSPYLNPIDSKNLNRSFPGKKEGSLTERIAHTITTEVISKSDYFVDIHSGDAPEDLTAYNAWYHCDALPEISRKGKDMALAMGFDYSVIFDIPTKRLEKPSLYCSQEAFHRKIPAVDIECGRLGSADENNINRIVDAMFLLLEHLGFIKNDHNRELDLPIIIKERHTVKSQSTGIFYSEKRSGEVIKKGETLGYITDFFGSTIETINATNDGIILYMIGTPPVNKGETLFSLGSIP